MIMKTVISHSSGVQHIENMYLAAFKTVGRAMVSMCYITIVEAAYIHVSVFCVFASQFCTQIYSGRISACAKRIVVTLK